MIIDNLYEEPSEVSGQVEWKTAFQQKIYDSSGKSIQLRSLFTKSTGPRITSARPVQTDSLSDSHSHLLIIFIRHFFCGNCQEYLRRLVNEPCFSSDNLAERNIKVVILGCGKYSLISSYRKVTKIPQSWPIFTDPTTDLYRILGMHRTLSLGKKSPRYIQRSLTSGMLQSVVQGMRRIPEGDVMGAGSLNVNGGEFFFSLNREDAQGGLRAEDWTLSWCHRMQNSRDHTEVDELLQKIGLVSRIDKVVSSTPKPLHKRTQSAPLIALNNGSVSNEGNGATLDQIDTGRSSLRRSLSMRRQNWKYSTEQTVRSKSGRDGVHT